MRPLSPSLLGLLVALVPAACSPDSTISPSSERTVAEGILTSFDRLTLARGDAASFRASLIGPGARLSPAGLRFASRNPSVAALSLGKGLARVQGVAAGHTWVVVQNDAAADSVEVVVQ